jgi:hypothetical protein
MVASPNHNKSLASQSILKKEATPTPVIKARDDIFKIFAGEKGITLTGC